MDPATTAPADLKEIAVRPTTQEDESPKNKPRPKSGAIPFEFTYFPSDDGVDENLLILLHGLGERIFLSRPLLLFTFVCLVRPRRLDRRSAGVTI